MITDSVYRQYSLREKNRKLPTTPTTNPTNAVDTGFERGNYVLLQICLSYYTQTGGVTMTDYQKVRDRPVSP